LTFCNNAGVIDTGLVVETTEAQWDAMMQVNKGLSGCKAVAEG
jgi:NADP-dependent 3-hydroxy acid dehydrogenase YdfG